ncbi:MAG: TerC family protein [Pirellulales bacterium]
MANFSLLAESLPTTVWHWVAFGVFVAVMLTLDLAVFHRKSHEPTLRESALWTVFWCLLAIAFNGLIWFWARESMEDPSEANRVALEFLVGYVVEWSLSMDNVFVFAVIFSFFRVPLKYQYRVLFWGILGAVVMRLTFVLGGAALLQQFEVVMAFFGLLLVWSAYKLAFGHDEEVNPDNNLLMRGARRVFPVAKEPHADHFFAIENGRRCVTPLFLVLLVVESTDVMFAVDSVPAILGLTKDTFIVFTSNVFAILGLRALYFMLAGAMDLFRYLKYGLSGILGFVGVKMIADYFAGVHVVPIWASLLVIVVLLGISVAASLAAKWRGETAPSPATEDPSSNPPGSNPDHAASSKQN